MEGMNGKKFNDFGSTFWKEEIKNGGWGTFSFYACLGGELLHHGRQDLVVVTAASSGLMVFSEQ